MNILGVLYISSLFKNRAPKDEDLITVFIGGSRQPDLINLDNDMLISLVSQDLKQIYGLKDKPIYTSKKVWNNSIPQYNIGFEKYINSIKKFEKNNKGFYFTGNFINGISLQNNMLNALEVVNNVNKKSYKYD